MAHERAADAGDRERVRVLVGYDGSPGSIAAVCVAALLLPGALAWTAHVWIPPADLATLRRMAVDAGSAGVLAHRMDTVGVARATRIATSGAALAAALGWQAEAVTRRGLVDPGTELVRLAEDLAPDLVLAGSRGLRGPEAALGSASDLLVHRSNRPVLVVGNPMADDVFTVAREGPVVVGWDGSEGAVAALAGAERLFPDRRVHAVTVGSGDAPPLPPHGSTPFDGGARRPDVVPLPQHADPLVHSRSVARALDDDAADRRAGLLVVGSRRRRAVSEVVLGSVAMATLHHARLPVLVVPPTWRVPAAT
jgi:nucleotide-binding universal stress UspA family protein